MKQIFIDKFVIPQSGRQEFIDRAAINRNIIKNLPGFIEDHAYEHVDENGKIVFITVATWADLAAINNAKELVQAEYKRQHFNPGEMMQRLGITMERGTFTEDSIHRNVPGKTEAHKQIIRVLYEDCLNKRKFDLLKNYVSEKFKGRIKSGPQGFEEPVLPLIDAFPDIQWKIEEMIAEGDKVVIRWTWTGFHKNPFNGYPAAQREVMNTAMAIYQFEDNKIVAVNVLTDRLGFLQQLGVVSPEIGVPRTDR